MHLRREGAKRCGERVYQYTDDELVSPAHATFVRLGVSYDQFAQQGARDSAETIRREDLLVSK
jgi:hypothetical protein